VEVPEDVVLNCFTDFGHVIEIHENEDEHGILTGVRTVKMTVTRDIPSSIRIGVYFVYIRYRNQRKCCHYCNRWDHVINVCPFRINNLCVRCSSPDHVVRNCINPWALDNAPVRVAARPFRAPRGDHGAPPVPVPAAADAGLAVPVGTPAAIPTGVDAAATGTSTVAATAILQKGAIPKTHPPTKRKSSATVPKKLSRRKSLEIPPGQDFPDLPTSGLPLGPPASSVIATPGLSQQILLTFSWRILVERR
jgi:hypothetical protein